MGRNFFVGGNWKCGDVDQLGAPLFPCRVTLTSLELLSSLVGWELRIRVLAHPSLLALIPRLVAGDRMKAKVGSRAGDSRSGH